MKIAIVDDELKERERMAFLLQDLLGDGIITDVFASGESFLASWEKGKYDLILLDIFMEEMLGIDVARKIRETDEDTRLVFCTTSNEFACESYEVNAQYYLHKPFNEQSVKTMLEKIHLEHYEMGKHLTLPDGQKLILRNVLYSIYHNHVITVHVKRGNDVSLRLSQSEFEALLAPYPYFCSPSKGIVVNFYEVDKKDDDRFVLSDGENLPISRRKNKEISELYEKFRFEQIRKEMNRR